jgi:malate dehydrogenase (oxaloacetate-decarboxylating)
VATGSPFDTVTIKGKENVVSQCNNLYVFPGMGLGALVCGTPRITDRMFMAASQAVSNMVSSDARKSGQVLPAIEDIRSVSANVALAVAIEARESGIGVRADDEQLMNMIRSAMWEPKYLPYRYVKPEPLF